MKKKIISLAVFGSLLAPLAVFAQTALSVTCATAGGTIEGIICRIANILNTVIPVLIVLGIVYFVWGVITYVISNEEEAKKAGRNRMIFGIIGLVVIVAVWGLVGIVTNTFGLNGNTAVNIPCITGTPGC